MHIRQKRPFDCHATKLFALGRGGGKIYLHVADPITYRRSYLLLDGVGNGAGKDNFLLFRRRAVSRSTVELLLLLLLLLVELIVELFLNHTDTLFEHPVRLGDIHALNFDFPHGPIHGLVQRRILFVIFR